MAPAQRDIYENDVDFAALAARDPAFAKRLKPNKQLDFSDPDSVLQLTKSLLHQDFDLDIDLPHDRLCPPVPNRFNYIIWLQDLLDHTSPDYRESYNAAREILGVDIGTGASAIYPLLACRQRPNWKLLATETDPRSFEYGALNISRNGLDERIKILRVDEVGKDDPLVPESVLERFEKIDFVMTNPPFYSSSHELLVSAKQKSRPANSICTGSPSEMITPGGEVGFVRRLILQSSQPRVKRKVQWWSSMLGKLSSVGVVVELLKKEGCRNWAVSEFVQGGKTRRWVVAWSWAGYRPGSSVARGVKAKALKSGASGRQAKAVEREEEQYERVEGGSLPFPSEFEFELRGGNGGGNGVDELGINVDELGINVDELGIRVDSEIRNLDLQWQWKPSLGTGLGIAQHGDCWSRRARRGRGRGRGRKEHETKEKRKDEDEHMRENNDEEEEEEGDDDEEGDEQDEEPELVFKVHVRHPRSDDDRKEKTGQGGTAVVTVRWLQGQDHVLFESFCGWLKKKLSLPSSVSPSLGGSKQAS